MNKQPKYNILSPDGISIEFDKVYNNLGEAQTAFENWKQRYTAQGYYSCRGNRIPLDELESFCKLVTI